MNTTKFHAYAVLNPGEKLQPWDYEPAALENTDVEIRITHNGLCHTDLHMRDDDWKVSQFPLVAGHEVVGEVAAVGSKVQNLQVVVSVITVYGAKRISAVKATPD